MLRFLQVTENKPEKIVVASENMKRGAVVTEDYATETVSKATDTTDFYFVDVEEVRDGINAVVEPTGDAWEDIKADMALKCLKGKEYIHSIGKWNEYIDYLRKELKV